MYSNTVCCFSWQLCSENVSMFFFIYFSLLIVKNDVWTIPTISAMRALYDNYERNSKIEETVTSQVL